MKKELIILFVVSMMILVGCKKVTVDFTYSPLEPKAGEKVSFTNTSSAGETWNWTFGDNAKSQSKNPSKVYKKPGEYVVTLMVDSAKNQTCSKVIKVYDTIPTFVCSSDSILIYHDVVFTANIYNPFNYELAYEWTLPDNCVLHAGTENSPLVIVYFTSVGENTLQLSIGQNNKTFDIQKTFKVHNTQAPAILMRRTDNTVVRQRMINGRMEQVTSASGDDAHLIELTNDTVVEFNGITFYASQMHERFGSQVKRMQLDHIKQIWYITTEAGLYAASFDGKHQKLIDAQATGALYVDKDRQRLYWATAKGLFAMPLVRSVTSSGTVSTTPDQYNTETNIDLITVNNKLQ